jgi:hypothetical protein
MASIITTWLVSDVSSDHVSCSYDYALTELRWRRFAGSGE